MKTKLYQVLVSLYARDLVDRHSVGPRDPTDALYLVAIPVTMISGSPTAEARLFLDKVKTYARFIAWVPDGEIIYTNKPSTTTSVSDDGENLKRTVLSRCLGAARVETPNKVLANIRYL